MKTKKPTFTIKMLKLKNHDTLTLRQKGRAILAWIDKNSRRLRPAVIKFAKKRAASYLYKAAHA